MPRGASLLADVISEAPDILCDYASGSCGFSPGTAGVREARSQRWAGAGALRFWIEVSRAFALDRLLAAGRVPPTPPHARRESYWSADSGGQLDGSRVAQAAAEGFSRGLPWTRLRRDCPSPEAVLLAAAIGEASAALAACAAAPARLAAMLRTEALAAARRLHAALPALPPARSGIGARTAAARVLDRDACGRAGVPGTIAGVARLYADSNLPLALAAAGGADFDLQTLEGAGFADKLLELLTLARVRAWALAATPGAAWHPDRILGGQGKPVLVAGGEDPGTRVWFQSSGGLGLRAWEWSSPAQAPVRGVPDITVTSGSGSARRTLLIDSKNYADASRLGDAVFKMLGYGALFGLQPLLGLVVRPGAAASISEASGPGGGRLVFLEMPPGAAGAQAMSGALGGLSGVARP